MRMIVKPFVIWTLGVAVLSGTADRSMAIPKDQTRWKCTCKCEYNGLVDHNVYFDALDCGVALGKVCSVGIGEFIRQGKITDCLGTPIGGQAAGAISPGGTGGDAPTVKPPEPVPPRGIGIVSPPIDAGKPPVAR